MKTREERLAFFNANVNGVHAAIEGANVKRASVGYPPLTESEVDDGLDAMIDLAKAGKKISSFRFPDPPAGTPKVKHSQPQDVHGDKLSFEIVKCKNGFLMNRGSEETFIFKTLEELDDIFRKILFTNWSDINIDEVNNERIEERTQGIGGQGKRPRRGGRANAGVSGADSTPDA